jgi:hypothetical protein
MQYKKLIAILSFSYYCIFAEASLFGQTQVIWKGGSPGRETKWECPKNWVGNKLPDEFSNVLIPDIVSGSNSFPELDDADVSINSLRIEGESILKIRPHGTLTVYAWVFYPNFKSIDNQGSLFIFNEHENKSGIITDKGLVGRKDALQQ